MSSFLSNPFNLQSINNVSLQGFVEKTHKLRLIIMIIIFVNNMHKESNIDDLRNFSKLVMFSSCPEARKSN